jgi:hypothetical protein
MIVDKGGLTPGSSANNEPLRDKDASVLFEDLITAVLFILIGVGAFVVALHYPIGTLHRMGAGMFPLLISGLIISVGVALALQSMRVVKGISRARISELIPTFTSIRALFFVMLALLTFAILVRPAGLLLATGALAFISTRAEPSRRLIPSLILSLILSCLSAAIFVYGIGLPIPLLPGQ